MGTLAKTIVKRMQGGYGYRIKNGMEDTILNFTMSYNIMVAQHVLK